MRVLIVSDYLFSYVGGAQSAILEQAEILASRGVNVALLYPRRRRDSNELGQEGITECSIASPYVLPGLELPFIRNRAKLRRGLMELMRRMRIDVVHVHSEFGLTSAVIDVATSLGVPVVHTVHTFFWTWEAPRVTQHVLAAPMRQFLQWFRGGQITKRKFSSAPVDALLRNMTLSTARRADLVVSPSAHQAALLEEARAGDVEIIPNAMNTPVGEPLGEVHGPLRVVWVGRCAPEKRLLVFVRGVLEAMDQLAENRLHVTVIGDGPDLRTARSMVHQASRESGKNYPIEFLGSQPRPTVLQHIRAAHLVALTSLGFDNQPMTVVEALLSARPVLYVDPALGEGLRRGGILAPSTDASGIMAVLRELSSRPEQVATYSLAAFEAAREFSPDTFASHLLSCYRSLITPGTLGSDSSEPDALVP